MKIPIAPYDPTWPLHFEGLKKVYWSRMTGLLADIQHIGSTSVPRLPAKPILDIDLVTETRKQIPAVADALIKLGYLPQGEKGINDRFAFGRVSKRTPDIGSGANWHEHHLYVCPSNSIALLNHLVFRDSLRADQELAFQYALLKQQLAEQVFGMEEYVKGKTNFILSVLRQHGLDQNTLKTIERENR